MSTTATTLSNFKLIAHAALLRGENRVLPIAVGGKQPLIAWKNTTLDTYSEEQWSAMAPAWIEGLSQHYPNANVAIIAKPDTVLFIDEDDSKAFREGYEAWSGEKFPATYATSARPNRLQSHFLQTDATRALGNIQQGGTSADISVRQHNLYVLSEGSAHKNGVDFYKSVGGPDILPMPDSLVAYLEHIRVKAKPGEKAEPIRDASGLVPHGSIHNYLLTEAGRLRNLGLSAEAIYPALSELAHKNCAPPLDENKIKAMAESIESFPEGQPSIVYNMKADADAPAAPLPEIDTSESAVRPTFPLWAVEGTSIYEGLVAPALQTSSKHAEFIMMPAIQFVLNYLSGKVEVGLGHRNHNIYLGLISPFGKFFKSSSCQLAMDYFNAMGLLLHGKQNFKNPEGRVVVAQAGSPEGFGLQAQKADTSHAVLYHDELGKFVSKAGIEGSAYSSDLLTWYEAGYFGNSTTNEKNRFEFGAGTYTFGWLWCTTDRNFNHYWPKLAGISSGLEDRLFFVVSQKLPKPLKAIHHAPPMLAALTTRKLLDKAVAQAKFNYESPETFERKVEGWEDPRAIDLVQKLSLYFAVDLDSQIITDDCIERAVALVEYRQQAARFLAPIEADNDDARLEQEIIREVQQHRGKMSYRELCRGVRYNHVGQFRWNRAFKGLLGAGLIFEFLEQRTPGKRPTRMVGLVKQEED